MTSSSTIPPSDPKNVQGDITIGFAKKYEASLFFNIDNANAFRKQLALLVPQITSAAQSASDRDAIRKHKEAGHKDLLKISGLNIAFSQFGLTTLGLNDDLGDAAFRKGQLNGAVEILNDKASDAGETVPRDWIPPFRSAIHGLIIVAGDCKATVDERLADAAKTLHLGTATGSTCHEVLRLDGAVRPGDQSGHEHFGFLDGISNPAVDMIDTKPFPGQETVRQGIILVGRDGPDNVQRNRPSWALDGSFLAFRYLAQLVPEFNDFLLQNALPGKTQEHGAELLGARLVGRWKSGAPVDLAPLEDDPKLGKDRQRNNHFNYDFPGDVDTQERCPFAAHVRKTNPRNDLGNQTEVNRILRRGIPFGPELTAEEKRQKKTSQERGLLFRCYQSDISNGFQFIQSSWANNSNFPFKSPGTPKPGFDAIIGQDRDPHTRNITGVDPNAPAGTLSLPTEWVIPKGGEYFFSPSIPALKTVFAKA